MLGGKNKQAKPLGYTIVEVLIVLAVSGMMFIIAANFINGKQQKTAFTQGVNEMASRIQDSVEQVTDGQYSDIPFACSASGAPLTISDSAGSNTQGTNSDCVFIGKFFQFYNNSDPSSYEVFSLAADRSKTSLGPDVTTVRANDGSSGVDLTTQQTVPQHLEVFNSLTIVNGSGNTQTGLYGFGFTQSQGTAGSTAGTYASGAQTINLVYSPQLNAPKDEQGAATAITGHVVLANSVTFCLTDGTYYAKFSIGGQAANGNKLGVKVQMKGKINTGC
jgi:hypothetical protein